MGIILRFPHHGRASLKPNTAGSTSPFPEAARASRTSRKFSSGILRRERQLLTADGPTPSKVATEAVPPSASTTSSTECSIPLDTSQSVKMSSLHNSQIVTNCEMGTMHPMPSRSVNEVSARLVALERALGLTPAELCRQAKIGANAWSQYTTAKNRRKISQTDAFKLKDTWGVPIEWTYDGDARWLPAEISRKLRRANAA